MKVGKNKVKNTPVNNKIVSFIVGAFMLSGFVLAGQLGLPGVGMANKNTTSAQQNKQEKKDSTKKRGAIVDYRADIAKKIINDTVPRLVGNVAFHHNGAIIQCDSALRYDDKHMDCYGKVIINQDTTYIYGDYVTYDGNYDLATVHAPLIKITNGTETVMYTYALEFNTFTSIGTFSKGGIVMQRDNFMEAEWGTFNSNTNEVTLHGNVSMRNNSYQLRTDSLKFNLDTEITTFLTTTYIWDNDRDFLLAHSGTYEHKIRTYKFTNDAYIMTPDQEVWADNVRYNTDTKEAYLVKNAQILDTTQKTLAFGDWGYYNDSLKKAILSENPSVRAWDNNLDTTYMRGDSLYFETFPRGTTKPDSTQMLRSQEGSGVEGMMVPKLDSLGNPILDSTGRPIMEIKKQGLDQMTPPDGRVREGMMIPKLDSTGNPILDSTGKPIMEMVKQMTPPDEREMENHGKPVLDSLGNVILDSTSKPVTDSISKVNPPTGLKTIEKNTVDSTNKEVTQTREITGQSTESSTTESSTGDSEFVTIASADKIQRKREDKVVMVRGTLPMPWSDATNEVDANLLNTVKRSTEDTISAKKEVANTPITKKRATETQKKQKKIATKVPVTDTTIKQASAEGKESIAMIARKPLLDSLGHPMRDSLGYIIFEGIKDSLNRKPLLDSLGNPITDSLGVDAAMDSLTRKPLLDSLGNPVFDSLGNMIFEPIHDSLLVKEEKKDTTERLIRAFRNVITYGKDFQMKCDSLVGYSVDSTMSLFGHPVLWSEENQILADRINAYFKNEKIDWADFIGSSSISPFVVQMIDTARYNQAKGRSLKAYFQDNELEKAYMKGNVMNYYYYQDEEDNEVIGFARMESAELTMNFRKRKPVKMVWGGEGDWWIYPMDQIPAGQSEKLDGFEWITQGRATSRRDVCQREERPSMRAETEAYEKPRFPLEEKIQAYKVELIKEKTWTDRVDKPNYTPAYFTTQEEFIQQ